jgi:manganese/iron transport system substrate-binding protein
MFLNLSFRNLAALSLLTGLVGCGSTPQSTAPSPSPAESLTASPAASGDRPVVVASHSVLCDLTQQIAADTIDMDCLIKPGADPHLYQPTPDDRKAIDTAKLVLYGGYDFEPSIIKLVEATSNSAPKVAVDEVAVPTPQKFEEDGKTVPDPHVWHNAQNGIQMANTIRDNLTKLEPSNAQLYAANAEKVTTELGKIDTWIKQQVATIPADSRKLVTTHDALGYYSKAYGIPTEEALGGISTEEAPTAGRVAELAKSIEANKVPTIFAEITINPKLIEAVAKEANVKVSDREIFADGLGEPSSDGSTYQKMLIANTQTIVEGLGGKFTPFQLKTSLLNSTSP